MNDDYEFINFINFEKKKKIFNSKIKNLKKKVKNDYTIIDTIDYNLLNIQFDILNNNHISERFIPIDAKIFIEKIEKSFINSGDIYNQFKNDLIRSKFIINNYNVTKPELIKDFLDFKYDKRTVDKILMLSTQAYLGLPFELIQNSLDGKYFSEISQNNNIPKKFIINIDTDNDTILFKINKNMRIFELNNDDAKTLCLVNIELDYDMENDNFIMMKLFIQNNYF